MPAADAGALLFSAWLEAHMQPHHCRIKDWRYLQAATSLVCDVILRLILCGVLFVVMMEGEG